MLSTEADGQVTPGAAGWHAAPGPHPPAPAEPGPPAAPDHDVLDSARSRLRSLPRAVAPGLGLRRCVEDLQLIDQFIQAAQRGSTPAPGRLDAGAALALLGNVRLRIDRLEADLLDVAQQLGVNWDLIAAITGQPAAAARDRLRVLRARPDPQ